MLSVKNTAAIMMCSIVATSSCIPAYAESIGKININANIECEGFIGELYVIVADANGNQKLAILNSKNNYEFNIDNLVYGKYEIRDIHVYNTDNQSSEDRKEIYSDFTIEHDNLDINENNVNPSISLNIHSIKTKAEELTNDKQSVIEEKSIEQNESNENQSSNNQQEENRSLSKRKKISFYNFIIDMVLILGLGSIWFFKVKEKKK
ncbi:hypothetical protein FDB50_15165 [Clostridium botulinum]|uniref:Uncharacterized protein n=1 Tax=Clostridium botulinum TaxID=1491 RepID=A0A846JTV5_CLOBO|nr:hypothetical protein [Clostridium botulinum]NFN06043.1 hypothetical protein [Clostridium botulinum]NFN36379.1 hypothetical protein [Clostridium botulinum]